MQTDEVQLMTLERSPLRSLAEDSTLEDEDQVMPYDTLLSKYEQMMAIVRQKHPELESLLGIIIRVFLAEHSTSVQQLITSS
jgi:hypothetical protein